ncbi:transmembrane protein, putative [Bodo saltans]|uniref:Transmembrane protein, putative n=1 Tax=Bodo saltans TaxID=75058 RepID=A0A0S4KLC7_BODSA|nr:transmembrane protein, putative [Bodo saltans]|eukprot:CUI14427.1 transmembrane protein, putative [Bodo saltans]
MKSSVEGEVVVASMKPSVEGEVVVPEVTARDTLQSALIVTFVGGVCGGILACFFMRDLTSHFAAMVRMVSLLCVCACYIFRLAQIYCCTTTSTTNVPSGERPLTRLVLSLAFAAVAAIIYVAFVTMISSDGDYASSEDAISSARGLAICLGMGTLSSIAMLGFLLETWASGLLSSLVIPVPIYFLPENITVVLFAVLGAVGCIIGAVCRTLVVDRGLLWCSNNIAVPTAAGFAIGCIAGVMVWEYGSDKYFDALDGGETGIGP